jgi:hypothetical protein
MRQRTTALFILGFTASLAACAGEPGDIADGEDDSFTAEGKADALGFPPGTLPSVAILTVANRASPDELRAAGIRADAARNIVAWRAGADGRPGNDDDRRFKTLEDLDGVKRVGPKVAQALRAYAIETGLYDPHATALIVPLVDSLYERSITSTANAYAAELGMHPAPRYLKLTGDELGRETLEYWWQWDYDLSNLVYERHNDTQAFALGLEGTPDSYFFTDGDDTFRPCWTGDGHELRAALDALRGTDGLFWEQVWFASTRFDGQVWVDPNIDGEWWLTYPEGWDTAGQTRDEVAVLWTADTEYAVAKLTVFPRCK